MFINKPSIVTLIVANNTAFPFEFKWFDESDIIVYYVPSDEEPNDIKHRLSSSSYDVSSGISKEGGTITINVPLANGDEVTIMRSLPVTRNVDYATRGNFTADVVNKDQDYQTYLMLDQQALNSFFLSTPFSSGGLNDKFPSSEPSNFIWWDENGKLSNNPNIPVSIVESQLSAWEALASELTANSYATEFVNGAPTSDEWVKLYESNGDGSFKVTTLSNTYSAKWMQFNAGNVLIRTDAATTNVAMDTREYHVIVDGETLFEVLYYDNKVNVSLNGLMLTSIGADCQYDDYALVSGGISLGLGALVGDVVRVQGFGVQGRVNGFLYPMDILYPRENLYPTNGLGSCGGTSPLPPSPLFPSELLFPSLTLFPTNI